MKTLRVTLFAAAIAATTLFAGCGGATGPQGATGPEGPQGPSGVTGVNASFTSNNGDWTATSASGYNYLLAGYTVNILTQDAINTGVVAVYFEATTGVWSPLPYTYPIGSGVEQTLTYNYAVNTLNLQMQNSDNSVPVAPSNPTIYNVVVIPTSVMKRHPGLNIKDYNAVTQVLATEKASY